MKKFLTFTVSLVAALWFSTIPVHATQGHGNRPAQTGIEHAEATANPNGVQHGIENAESKQAAHKHKAKKHKARHHRHHSES